MNKLQAWNLFFGRNNRREKKADREDLLRFDNSNFDTSTPCYSIKSRNKIIWQPLYSLSSTNWKKYRGRFNDTLIRLYSDFRTLNNSYNVLRRKLKTLRNTHTDMFAFMYNQMNASQRKEFIKLYPCQEEKIKHSTCSVCKNIEVNGFVKCRHSDCSGMCKNCHSKWKKDKNNDDGFIFNNSFSENQKLISGANFKFDERGIVNNNMFIFGNPYTDKHVCPACEQSQLYTCPICYDDVDDTNIMLSDNCEHYICKNCFCTSFNSNPIVDCPMCRKQFKKTLSKTNYNDGIPEDALVV